MSTRTRCIVPVKRTFLAAIIISSIISSLPFVIAEEGLGDIDEVWGENEKGPTRNDVIEKDLDIQFMIEPSNDPLDPLYEKKWTAMEGGEEADFWVLISNIGSVNDSYHIELNDPPMDAGWRWYIKETGTSSMEVNLTSVHQRDLHSGISFTTLIVHVWAPIDATRITQVPVIIKAESENGGDQNKSIDHDEITIVVGHVDGMSIHLNHPTIYYSRPGEWLTIPMDMTNLGNKDVITVEVTVEMNNFWITSLRKFENLYQSYEPFLEFSWTRMEVEIKQGETVERDLKFRLPLEWTGEDDVYQFRYIGRFKETNYFMWSDIITVIGEKYSVLSVETDFNDPINITPGEKLEYNITVNNTGWSEDLIEDVYLLDPKGIEFMAFNETGEDLYRMKIPGRSSKTIDMEFEVANDTPPGPIDIQVLIDPFYFDPLLVNLTLMVQEKKELELISPDQIEDGYLDIGPGEQRRIVIGIRNNGNTQSNFNLDILKMTRAGETFTSSSLDKGWGAIPEWISMDIQPLHYLGLEEGQALVDTRSFTDDIGYRFRTEQEMSRPILIEPGGVIWMGYIISSPDGGGREILNVYEMGIFLHCEDINPIEPINLIVEVLYPDLEFQGEIILTDENGSPINSSEMDRKVFFSVSVSNPGDWYSRGSFIAFYSGSEEISRTEIEPMGPGESVMINGNFTTRSETTGYRVELDPDNNVIELDDQFMTGSIENANVGYVRLEVNDNDEARSFVFPVFIIILILVCIIMLGLVVYIRKNAD